MAIRHILTSWIGSTAQCEEIRQFARDFDWGPEPLDDPAWSAGEAADMEEHAAAEDDQATDPEAVSFLRNALFEAIMRSKH